MFDLPAGARGAFLSHSYIDTGIHLGEYRPGNGDHLCSVWTHPRDDRRAGMRFLQNVGPDEGALCVLDPSRDLLGEPPREPDFSPAIYSTSNVHVEGGYFDPERMRGFWRQRSLEASGRGVRHLRAVAEMAWALQGLPGTEHAEVFESSLNPALSTLPISVICQYGSTRFPPRIVLAMLLIHPKVIIGERLFSNPFYVKDEEFPARLERLSVDSIGALIPIWRHFLHRLPSSRDLATFLCNSLPSLLPSTSVSVQIEGAACGLDTTLEVLTEVDDAAPPSGTLTRLVALWATSHGMLGGAVHVGTDGTRRVLDVTFEGGLSRIVLERTDDFSSRELLRFTNLASAVGTALAALPKASATAGSSIV